jgi:hypothetical protein
MAVSTKMRVQVIPGYRGRKSPILAEEYGIKLWLDLLSEESLFRFFHYNYIITPINLTQPQSTKPQAPAPMAYE